MSEMKSARKVGFLSRTHPRPFIWKSTQI